MLRLSQIGVHDQTLMQTLRVGSSGSDVTQWQKIIGVPADGAFGPQTEAATKVWQSSHGLAPDGVVGPMTWSAAGQAPTSSTSSSGVPVPAFPGFVKLSAGDQKAFVKAAQWIAPGEQDAPKWLAAIIDFESNRTWSPSVRNATSGATGLIQFLPSTARNLGTTVDALAAMSFANQLEYVKKYFQQIGVVGKIHSLADMYLSVFSPKGVGMHPDAILYTAGQAGYDQNAGLDRVAKGFITVGDVASAPLSRLNSASGVVLVSMGLGLFGIGLMLGAGYLALRFWKGS